MDSLALIFSLTLETQLFYSQRLCVCFYSPCLTLICWETLSHTSMTPMKTCLRRPCNVSISPLALATRKLTTL